MQLPRRQFLPECRKMAAIGVIANAAETSNLVKGFGCRQAYESLSCRNPRATVDGYGDFELRPMSVIARLPLGGVGMATERPFRCASALSSPSRTRLFAALSAAIVTMDARRSAAGGEAPAAEGTILPCRVMERSPGSWRLHRAVRVAAAHRSNTSMTIMRPPQQGSRGTSRSWGNSRSSPAACRHGRPPSVQ